MWDILWFCCSIVLMLKVNGIDIDILGVKFKLDVVDVISYIYKFCFYLWILLYFEKFKLMKKVYENLEIYFEFFSKFLIEELK